MLTAQIISLVLFVLLLLGSAMLAAVANGYGYYDIAAIYNWLTAFSAAGIVFAIIGIVASSQHGKAFKRKRWAIICTAVLDLVLGILGLIGAGSTTTTALTYILYIAVIVSGIVLFIELYRATKALAMDFYDEVHIPVQPALYNPNLNNPTGQSPETTPVQSTLETKSAREKLLEAKALFDEGLITEQEYSEKRRIILENDESK